ncbi:MAG: hypothetical protein HY738_01900 [Bacteroidia bacterium]|nr:hypothetical protein [Bacteroidia bacterium]
MIELKPLKGDISLTEDTIFSLRGWFSGKYQEKKEKYLNESFGFRSTMVRLNNQIAFSFFNKAKANGVIIGRRTRFVLY